MKIYLLDKNSSIGLAIALVSDIFDRSSKTSGNILTIVSRVSSVKIVSALIYGCGVRRTATQTRYSSLTLELKSTHTESSDFLVARLE